MQCPATARAQLVGRAPVYKLINSLPVFVPVFHVDNRYCCYSLYLYQLLCLFIDTLCRPVASDSRGQSRLESTEARTQPGNERWRGRGVGRERGEEERAENGEEEIVEKGKREMKIRERVQGWEDRKGEKRGKEKRVAGRRKRRGRFEEGWGGDGIVYYVPMICCCRCQCSCMEPLCLHRLTNTQLCASFFFYLSTPP